MVQPLLTHSPPPTPPLQLHCGQPLLPYSLSCLTELPCTNFSLLSPSTEQRCYFANSSILSFNLNHSHLSLPILTVTRYKVYFWSIHVCGKVIHKEIGQRVGWTLGIRKSKSLRFCLFFLHWVNAIHVKTKGKDLNPVFCINFVFINS